MGEVDWVSGGRERVMDGGLDLGIGRRYFGRETGQTRAITFFIEKAKHRYQNSRTNLRCTRTPASFDANYMPAEQKRAVRVGGT